MGRPHTSAHASFGVSNELLTAGAFKDSRASQSIGPEFVPLGAVPLCDERQQTLTTEANMHSDSTSRVFGATHVVKSENSAHGGSAASVETPAHNVSSKLDEKQTFTSMHAYGNEVASVGGMFAYSSPLAGTGTDDEVAQSAQKECVKSEDRRTVPSGRAVENEANTTQKQRVVLVGSVTEEGASGDDTEL